MLAVTVVALMPLYDRPLGDGIEPPSAAELRHDPRAPATLTIHLLLLLQTGAAI